MQKMAGYVRKVLDYCRGYDYATFSADSKLAEACVFNLSKLGELCKVAEASLTVAHPEISWREMYGLRNHIAHDYEGVNLKLVWEIIQGDLPELEKALNKLL